MKSWAKKQKGFTIVELLIVIVVIAILAAITIVAYNGIQQRARNETKIAAANAIVKAIDSYTITKGTQLPGYPACIPTGGKDYSGDGIPDCGIGLTTSENATTNTALTNAGITNLKFPNDVITSTDGTKYAGIQITYGAMNRGVNGTLQPLFLYFFLEGSNQDCTSGYSIVGTVNPDPLYAYTFGKSYGSTNGVTYCGYTLKYYTNL